MSWARYLMLVGAVSVAAPAAAQPDGGSEAGWRQWGGPGRDFYIEDVGLGESWPDQGPAELWRRPLGPGHSSILVDQGRLFTMYRPGAEGEPWADEERVIALDAATGQTLWEFGYASEPVNFRFGAGPHATPLVVGPRLFTLGTNKQLHAFDKTSGDLLWSHDLVADFDAPPTLIRPAVKAGNGASPTAYRDLVIVPAGGPGQSVMAFSQSDGALVWRSGRFLISPSTPMLVEVDGQTQLIVFGGETINGLDPETGDVLWTRGHATQGDMNNSTPIWGDDNILVMASAYDGGTRALRLERRDQDTAIEELWFTSRLKVMFGNVVRRGDYLYASSGDFGPAFLTAVDVHTGEVVWQERGYGRASFVQAGESTVMLTEDGELVLGRLSPDGFTTRGRADVFETTAWTAPTLVGTTLYLRDRAEILALDLGE